MDGYRIRKVNGRYSEDKSGWKEMFDRQMGRLVNYFQLKLMLTDAVDASFCPCDSFFIPHGTRLGFTSHSSSDGSARSYLQADFCYHVVRVVV